MATIEPEEFLEKFLVEPFNRTTGPQLAGVSMDEVTQFNILGDEGGFWYTQIIDGEMILEEDIHDEPLVQVTLTREDHDELIGKPLANASDQTVDDVSKPVVEMLAQFVLSPAKMKRVKALKGNFQLQLRHGSRTYKATLTFGADVPYDVDEPNATIQLDLQDLGLLLEGKLDPQKAFVEGKIKLKGDMNLAMAVPMLMIT